MTQPELDLFRPRAESAQIEALAAALRGRGFVPAKVLQRELGCSDRQLRALAEADLQGRIVSWPGSPGYALGDECDVPTLRRGAEATESQARLMLGRAKRIRRALERQVRQFAGKR